MVNGTPMIGASQHGSHLDPCLTCSSFDTWLHMSNPTCAKFQLVTLGTSKNVKFLLSCNSMKFDGVCNTQKYTLVVFNVFKVFCRHKLNFS